VLFNTKQDRKDALSRMRELRNQRAVLEDVLMERFVIRNSGATARLISGWFGYLRAKALHEVSWHSPKDISPTFVGYEDGIVKMIEQVLTLKEKDLKGFYLIMTTFALIKGSDSRIYRKRTRQILRRFWPSMISPSSQKDAKELKEFMRYL